MKEIGFYLNDFVTKKAQNFPDYKSCKREIEEHGYFRLTIDEIKTNLYTPELGAILLSKSLSALNMENKEETTISGQKYLESFKVGFSEGETHFEQEFAINVNTIYGVNADTYVNDLHANYFHTKVEDLQKGWVFVKHKYPIIISESQVKLYGFYSGIVSKVDLLVKKYPNQFKDFYKCELHKPLVEVEQITIPKRISDEEFISGKITLRTWYGAHPDNWGIKDPKINVPDFWFEVSKEGQKRVYNSGSYISHNLENYYNEIDSKPDIEEKVAIFKTAEFFVKSTIHEYQLNSYNIDFSRIVERMKMTEDYLNSQLTFKNSKVKAISKKNTKDKPSIKTFEGLFSKEGEAEFCIGILKTVEPPIVNDSLTFLLGERQKGAVVAWIKALQKKGKIPHVKDEVLSKLLNEKIAGLNLSPDGRTLRNTETTGYRKYYKSILELIT